MSEYIDRETLINEINLQKRLSKTSYPKRSFVVGDVLTCIYTAPAADVVEVVRCKDCKHYHEKVGWCDKHSHFIGSQGEACHPWESSDWKMFAPDDFCSYGERKDTDG